LRLVFACAGVRRVSTPDVSVAVSFSHTEKKDLVACRLCNLGGPETVTENVPQNGGVAEVAFGTSGAPCVSKVLGVVLLVGVCVCVCVCVCLCVCVCVCVCMCVCVCVCMCVCVCVGLCVGVGVGVCVGVGVSSQRRFARRRGARAATAARGCACLVCGGGLVVVSARFGRANVSPSQICETRL
jgi:uncharacterized membrane protein